MRRLSSLIRVSMKTRNVSWRNMSRHDRTFSGFEEPSSYRRLRIGTRFAIVSSRYQYGPFFIILLQKFCQIDKLLDYLRAEKIYILPKRNRRPLWGLRPVAFAISACTWLIRHCLTVFCTTGQHNYIAYIRYIIHRNRNMYWNYSI